MPSRGGSRGNNPKTAVRSLMHKVPDENELWKLLLGLGDLSLGEQANSRTAAIFGGAYLEHALMHAITAHLHTDPDMPGFDFLFNADEAPLRDFSARIKMAKALGIMGIKDYRDLESIRAIRNLFAHSKALIDFSTPEVIKLCDRLSVVQDLELADMGIELNPSSKGVVLILAPTRRAFAAAVAALYWKLTIYPVVAMPGGQSSD